VYPNSQIQPVASCRLFYLKFVLIFTILLTPTRWQQWMCDTRQMDRKYETSEDFCVGTELKFPYNIW